jgi:CDP-diacylglycerol--glycerol-3-phosphate 3-phosphatidyltransferase
VTLAGFVLTVLAAYMIYRNEVFLGGLVFLVASVTDMIDGSLARLSGTETRFGAALDSIVDRLGEAAIVFGLVLLFLRTGNDIGVILAFLTLTTSFSVSYLRARGEGLGMVMNESGVFTRLERIITWAVGLLTGWIIAALVVITVFSLIAMVQRVNAIRVGSK